MEWEDLTSEVTSGLIVPKYNLETLTAQGVRGRKGNVISIEPPRDKTLCEYAVFAEHRWVSLGPKAFSDKPLK